MKVYLTSGKGVLSWLIKKFTGSDVTHLMMDDVDDFFERRHESFKREEDGFFR